MCNFIAATAAAAAIVAVASAGHDNKLYPYDWIGDYGFGVQDVYEGKGGPRTNITKSIRGRGAPQNKH